MFAWPGWRVEQRWAPDPLRQEGTPQTKSKAEAACLADHVNAARGRANHHLDPVNLLVNPEVVLLAPKINLNLQLLSPGRTGMP